MSNSNLSEPLISADEAILNSQFPDSNQRTSKNEHGNEHSNEQSANLNPGFYNGDNISHDSFDRQLEENLPIFTNDSRFNKIKNYLQNFYQNNLSGNVGIILLLTSQFFNSIMVTTCKLLVTDKNFETPIHPLQILFIRMIITYICCLLYMFITKSVEQAPWGPKEIRHLLVIRGFVGFIGVFGLYYSLQYLSLSDAVAITFLIPMVTAFLAWILLKERYSFLEGICGLISLSGVLLIAKPKFLFGKESESETSVDDKIESSLSELRLLATGVGLLGVLGAAGVYIILRKIGKHAHPLLSVSYFALITCIISFFSLLFIPSLSFALPQNNYQWFLFLLIGVSGFFMQFCLTAGVQRVKAGKSSLMIYTNMVFAVFWDLTIWGHFPGILSLLGTILIIANAYIVIRYKKNDDEPNHEPVNDIENQNIINGNNDDDENKFNSIDNISLQDFIINDDDESEHKSTP